jgi:methyl-accepting chemotaxis protein
VEYFSQAFLDVSISLGTLYNRRLFDMDPSAAEVFKFDRSALSDPDEFYQSERLMKHAMMFINMLDRALQLLGPDSDMMSDILKELGEKHIKYGVKPHHFAAMGEALMGVLVELLGDTFGKEAREAWSEVYRLMSCDMIQARTPTIDLFPVHPGRRQSGDNWVIIDVED